MSRKPRIPPAPLPQRQGVDPVRVRLPVEGPLGHRSRAPRRAAQRRRAPESSTGCSTRGRSSAPTGGPSRRTPPTSPACSVWFHRELPAETPVPFPLEVVYRDEHIVVVDKPHFLATTPRGSHVTETALARLRRELGLPALAPAHRLDRLTAGLVLFTVRPEERGAYQSLFRDRRVPRSTRRRPVRSRARPAPDRAQPHREGAWCDRRYEVAGEPNAVSRIEMVGHRGDGLGRYRLLPSTGQTHQLRVHMNALGTPVLGDPLYPVVADPVPAGDFRRPLQLLARALEFTDPVTGVEHRFLSTRALLAWSSYGDWAGQ